MVQQGAGYAALTQPTNYELGGDGSLSGMGPPPWRTRRADAAPLVGYTPRRRQRRVPSCGGGVDRVGETRMQLGLVITTIRRRLPFVSARNRDRRNSLWNDGTVTTLSFVILTAFLISRDGSSEARAMSCRRGRFRSPAVPTPCQGDGSRIALCRVGASGVPIGSLVRACLGPRRSGDWIDALVASTYILQAGVHSPCFDDRSRSA
jgi:hypothetical protein